MVQMNLFAGRNRYADIENGRVGLGGERRVMNSEIGTAMHTLPRVKQTASGHTAPCIRQGAQLGALWWPSGVGCSLGRREVQERKAVCVHIAVSFHCTRETNNTL